MLGECRGLYRRRTTGSLPGRRFRGARPGVRDEHVLRALRPGPRPTRVGRGQRVQRLPDLFQLMLLELLEPGRRELSRLPSVRARRRRGGHSRRDADRVAIRPGRTDAGRASPVTELPASGSGRSGAVPGGSRRRGDRGGCGPSPAPDPRSWRREDRPSGSRRGHGARGRRRRPGRHVHRRSRRLAGHRPDPDAESGDARLGDGWGLPADRDGGPGQDRSHAARQARRQRRQGPERRERWWFRRERWLRRFWWRIRWRRWLRRWRRGYAGRDADPDAGAHAWDPRRRRSRR